MTSSKLTTITGITTTLIGAVLCGSSRLYNGNVPFHMMSSFEKHGLQFIFVIGFAMLVAGVSLLMYQLSRALSHRTFTEMRHALKFKGHALVGLLLSAGGIAWFTYAVRSENTGPTMTIFMDVMFSITVLSLGLAVVSWSIIRHAMAPLSRKSFAHKQRMLLVLAGGIFTLGYIFSDHYRLFFSPFDTFYHILRGITAGYGIMLLIVAGLIISWTLQRFILHKSASAK